MKIQMESTETILTLDGVECRLWNAVTDDGIPCLVFVHRIAVAESGSVEAFEGLKFKLVKQIRGGPDPAPLDQLQFRKNHP